MEEFNDEFDIQESEFIRALEEDLGKKDLNTLCLPDPDVLAIGTILAKENLVLAGIDIACAVFHFLYDEVSWQSFCNDGEVVVAGKKIARVEAPAWVILDGERTALNFLQHLSGIATLTRKFVDAVRPYNVIITDTRKTIPGMRRLEKMAVRAGGGRNHRFGLYDGVIIKDNHLNVGDGIKNMIMRVKEQIHHLYRIEIEAQNLEQVKEALEAGADVIMLDNMTPDEVKVAVKLVNKKALIEVSGGINLENVRQYAEAGVDFISIGALTHSAKAVDISLELRKKIKG